MQRTKKHIYYCKFIMYRKYVMLMVINGKSGGVGWGLKMIMCVKYGSTAGPYVDLTV